MFPGLWVYGSAFEAILTFPWNVVWTSTWEVLSVCFLLVEFWKSGSLFHVFSVFFSLNRFHFYKIFESCASLVYVLVFIPLDKRLFHRSFLDNPITIFCWGGPGGIYELPLFQILFVIKYSSLFDPSKALVIYITNIWVIIWGMICIHKLHKF